jgi:thrombospondin type 3 repeat protein
MKTIVGCIVLVAALAFAAPAFAVDADGDFIADEFDNCPFTYNYDQADVDGDNTGDACDDTDSRDPDNDGYPNSSDNCPFTPNGQEDMDGDGVGNACDPDSDVDGDGWLDTSDNCPDAFNPDQSDVDSDAIGDVCDVSDVDGDGYRDQFDNCPTVPNPSQTDADHDGKGAACDTKEVPTTQDDCAKDRWRAFNGTSRFRNQGECVAFVKKPPPKPAAKR